MPDNEFYRCCKTIKYYPTCCVPAYSFSGRRIRYCPVYLQKQTPFSYQFRSITQKTSADDEKYEKAIKEELKSNYHGIETLSIGVTMTIGEYAIVDKLSDFLNRHPKTNIHIHYGNTSQLLHLLDNGQINIAIVEGNYPKENYTHKKYRTEDYIAVCAATHNFLIGQPHTIDDLVCERLLLREKGSGTRDILEQSLIARGMRISDFIHYTEVENMHTIIGLLKRTVAYHFCIKLPLKMNYIRVY